MVIDWTTLLVTDRTLSQGGKPGYTPPKKLKSLFTLNILVWRMILCQHMKIVRPYDLLFSFFYPKLQTLGSSNSLLIIIQLVFSYAKEKSRNVYWNWAFTLYAQYEHSIVNNTCLKCFFLFTNLLYPSFFVWSIPWSRFFFFYRFSI